MMKKTIIMIMLTFFGAVVFGENEKAPKCGCEQWVGLNVAILGDSITDKCQCSYQKLYWQFLGDWLNWNVNAYGISGHQWCHLVGQADYMTEQMGDNVDAIFIFAGTNDYCGGIPLGEWYNYSEEKTNWWGNEMTLKRRSFAMDEGSLRGRINIVLSKLKKRYPKAAIVVLTPLHRAYATFGATNIQPAEDFPNTIGLYIDDYVRVIREAGDIWGVEVIDLYGASGMIPLQDEYTRYFRDENTDRLHPNEAGHLRMADLIYCRLSAIPAAFRK